MGQELKKGWSFVVGLFFSLQWQSLYHIARSQLALYFSLKGHLSGGIHSTKLVQAI